MENRNHLYFKFILITIFSSFFLMDQSLALELDEKLTTRLLKVSQSKKTVLLNRGLEDGLVVGDHAKFFLTTGMVARGVVVKCSPTRSIWSIYRVIEPEVLFKNKVVNIKITKGMQITEDQTRSMIADRKTKIDVPQTIVLAPGANDLDQNMSEEDQEDVRSLTNDNIADVMESVGVGNRTLEVFGLLNFNNMSVSSDLSNGNQSSGVVSAMDFSLGMEKYFDSESWILRSLSFSVFFHKSTHETTGLSGTQISLDSLAYGGGVSYHFTDALSFGRIIPYLTLNFGIGATQDTIQFQSNTVTTDPETLEGSSTFISAGAGAKYFLKNGFGARVIIDIYQRGEIYNIDDGSEYTKTVSGPRVQMGVAYRF